MTTFDLIASGGAVSSILGRFTRQPPPSSTGEVPFLAYHMGGGSGTVAARGPIAFLPGEWTPGQPVRVRVDNGDVAARVTPTAFYGDGTVRWAFLDADLALTGTPVAGSIGINQAPVATPPAPRSLTFPTTTPTGTLTGVAELPFAGLIAQQDATRLCTAYSGWIAARLVPDATVIASSGVPNVAAMLASGDTMLAEFFAAWSGTGLVSSGSGNAQYDRGSVMRERYCMTGNRVWLERALRWDTRCRDGLWRGTTPLYWYGGAAAQAWEAKIAFYAWFGDTQTPDFLVEDTLERYAAPGGFAWGQAVGAGADWGPREYAQLVRFVASVEKMGRGSSLITRQDNSQNVTIRDAVDLWHVHLFAPGASWAPELNRYLEGRPSGTPWTRLFMDAMVVDMLDMVHRDYRPTDTGILTRIDGMLDWQWTQWRSADTPPNRSFNYDNISHTVGTEPRGPVAAPDLNGFFANNWARRWRRSGTALHRVRALEILANTTFPTSTIFSKQATQSLHRTLQALSNLVP